MKFRTKLMLSFLFLVLIVSGFYYFNFSYSAKSFFISESKEDLLGQARLVRILVVNNDHTKISPQQLSVKLGTEINSRVTIIDTFGAVIGDSAFKESELGLVENHLQRPEVQEALRDGIGSSVRYSETIKTSMLYLALPFETPRYSGVVRLARPLDFLSADTVKLHNLVGGTLMIIMLIAVGISIIISRLISRPLSQMTSIAKNISNNQVYQPVRIDSSDEFGVLAEVLNNMGARISSQISELESEKQRLDAILKGMGEGVMVVLFDGTVLMVNPSFCDLFQVAEFKVGSQLPDILDNPELLACFNDIRQFGKELNREIHIPDCNATLLTHWVPLSIYNSGEGVVAVFHDITERKLYEEALWKSEERFRRVVESSLTGMHFFTLENDCLILTGANPSADSILGQPHWPLLGMLADKAFPELSGQQIFDIFRRVAAGELESQAFEYDVMFGQQIKCFDIRVFLTGPMCITVEFADITERKRLQDELRDLSEKDPLTALYNRRKLYELLLVELKKAKRHNRSLSLIIFDIDYFKSINDAYGHDAGDFVLVTIARVVAETLRTTDIFARYGGEEFVIVCPETDLDGAVVLAEKIRSAVENFAFTDVGRVTISSGISVFRVGDDVGTLIKRADTALYGAKESGRNRVFKG
jgi:diguanylate cyclase (GGDEF)-like protein/PAS domain S-box-containing protein